jgi:threonine dehydrogenase-like Zn-dependent dehydrogenase
MQAAVLIEPRRIEVRDVPRPSPGPRQVRVRLAGCGVSASNLPLWEGRPWFRYPLEPGAPGHEGWGTIDAIGCDVSGLAEGTRVALLSGHAFAEYDVADAAAVVPLPTVLEGAEFPGEPLGGAFNVLARSGITAGQAVAIVGVGFLGAVLTALAAQAGARVFAISRRPWALAVARRLGASETLELNDIWTVIKGVRTQVDAGGCDVVLECTGAQAPLDLAAELVRVRGRLIIAGYHQDGPRQVNLQRWNWQGLDVINAHERDPAGRVAGIRAAAEAVAAGTLRPGPLYTQRVGLDRLGEAFRLMVERPDGFLKALLAF